MATNKLKPKFCDTAPTGNHFDGEGLYLMVTPDLKRHWRMACYLNGKRKLLAFGRYPQTSLAQAREKRRNAQELLKQGIDPVQHERQIKAAQEQAKMESEIEAGNTFEQIARRLHESKRGRTIDEYRDKMLRQFELHVFPIIGHKALPDIAGRELLALFKSVAQKTVYGRPMTYMAKRLCQWAAEVYDFAIVEGAFSGANHCRVIIKHLPAHETKHMARVQYQELPKFIQALGEYNGHALTKAAIWMLLYTGQRQASVRRARWGDFDLAAAEWHRRPEKADKEVHTLPLPKQAVALLQATKPLTAQGDDDLAFPSVRSNFSPMSEASVCQAIKRMGFEMVGHGLRGVVSTGLNEQGFSPRLVEVQLGHKKSDSIEAAYNDAKHFKERAKMMQAWADHLARAATLRVLPLKKRA